MAIANSGATNQTPPLVGYDVIGCDAALVDALKRFGDESAAADLAEVGTLSAEAREHGVLANRFPPQLRTHDRHGDRVDEVGFHPSWHWLLERAIGFGLAGAAWTDPSPHARFCASRLGGQAGAGTFGVLPSTSVLAAIVRRTTPVVAA
jgi:putative acyl-CoA dehydrogenase